MYVFSVCSEYYFSDENLQKDFFLRGQVCVCVCVPACCNVLIFIVKCGALSISVWENLVVLSKLYIGIVSLSFVEYPDSQLEWFRWELCIMVAVLTCPKIMSLMYRWMLRVMST